MADAIISAVIDHLISIPLTAAEKEVKLLLGVNEEFEKLKHTFRHIRAAIEDAEKRQISDEEVQLWFTQLKKVAYEAEDILDEWSTMIFMNNKKKKVCAALTSCIKSTFKSTSLRHKISHGIEEINERVDEIVSAMHKFNFVNGRTNHNQVVQHRETISGVDESNIRGRVHDKDVILKLLLDETSNKLPLTMITIWGMGGLGKTTLAQLLFNDEYVEERFTTIWVCVSDPFDKIKVAKAIIEAIDGQPPGVVEWDAVHSRLSSSLKDKLFLLVLDDVWTEDVETWEPFKLSFGGGAYGSKIIVTTRKEEVAKMVESTYTHELSKLSEDECWSLFSSRAFAGWSKEESESFERIGKKLSKKCDGLPMAAKILGCFLQHKTSIHEWKNILVSPIWAEKTKVLPTLLLSYYDLTPQLKRCFEYCAIYPQDYIIEKEELIRLWMANGFLSSANEDQLEFTGNSYFETLVARSFFLKKVSEIGGPYYTMHDLIHEFAESIAKKECLSVTAMNNDTTDLGCSSLRHLKLSTVDSFDRYAAAIFSSSSKATLRTFIRKYDFDSENRYSPVLSTSTIVSSNSSKRLRVLDLKHSLDLKILPNRIAKLIHLRFLDLSSSNLVELPDAVGNLYNLQILDISDCSALRRITEKIGNLVNLRHLLMQGTKCLLPEEIGKLTSLRTLNFFYISYPITYQGSHYAKLGDLKNLNQLQSLAVYGLSRVTSEQAAEAQLKNKRDLSTLCLSFAYFEDDVESILDCLEPPSHLEELEISDYGGSRFPRWMGSDLISSKLRSLQKLTLSSCKKVVAAHHQIFPGTLRELDIDFCRELSWTSVCFPPLLEKLTLGRKAGVLSRSFSILCCHPDHNKIKTLELGYIKVFPQGLRRLTALHSLKINFVSRLETLMPGGEDLQHLRMLQTLEICSCSQQLQKRCAGEGAEEWNIISHIPNIIINGKRILESQPADIIK